MVDLDVVRTQIDGIDQTMSELFVKRMELLKDVIAYKVANNKDVLDEQREQDMIQRNLKRLSNPEFIQEYELFLKTILEQSRMYQSKHINNKRVGYCGTLGAFAYIVCQQMYPSYDYIAFPTFEEVVLALENKEIEFGVLPFENSYTGEVVEVSDLLYSHKVYIHEVYDLKVDQNLLGIRGSKISDIKKIYSHAQGLSQCSLFLKGRDIELVSYPNTALAAKFVSDLNDKSVAAIASKDTAELFDLIVLEENIQTSSDNTTRFVVATKDCPTSGTYFRILFTTKNETGALATAMNLIASYGYNMESIRSRAIPRSPWKYYFHVEMKGSLHSEQTKTMLEALKSSCEDIKILGSYTRGENV